MNSNSCNKEVFPCVQPSSGDVFLNNDFPHVASPVKDADGYNMISWIEPMEDLLPPPPLTLFSSMDNNNNGNQQHVGGNKLVDPTPIGPRGSLRVVDQFPLTKALEDLANGCSMGGPVDAGMDDCFRPFVPTSSVEAHQQNVVTDEVPSSSPAGPFSTTLPTSFEGQVVQPSRIMQNMPIMTLPFGIQSGVSGDMPTIMSPPLTKPTSKNVHRMNIKGKVAPRRVSCDEHFSQTPKTVSPSSSSPSSSSSTPSKSSCKLRSFQSKLWKEKFEELLDYREKFGTCHVPHDWKGNPALAKWVKRQRYQYKLKRDGKHTTLTDEREDALNDVGFVWQSHRSAWEERFDELCAFRMVNGHCSVPATASTSTTPAETTSSGGSHQTNANVSGASPQLSVWVQCQRRQYRLFLRGERSFMTEERIQKLNSIGFVWKPRGSSQSPSSSPRSDGLVGSGSWGQQQNQQVLLQL